MIEPDPDRAARHDSDGQASPALFHVVLFEPEIPPNTGNIIRLCANVPATLHLIGPLGFMLDDRRLRRAGLDHSDRARIHHHQGLDACMQALPGARWLAFSTRAERCYTRWQFQPGDALLFGPETRGLPDDVLARFDADRRLRIPQRPSSRSLNLSNAVAVAVYEGWRQMGFVDPD